MPTYPARHADDEHAGQAGGIRRWSPTAAGCRGAAARPCGSGRLQAGTETEAVGPVARNARTRPAARWGRSSGGRAASTGAPAATRAGTPPAPGPPRPRSSPPPRPARRRSGPAAARRGTATRRARRPPRRNAWRPRYSTSTASGSSSARRTRSIWRISSPSPAPTWRPRRLSAGTRVTPISRDAGSMPRARMYSVWLVSSSIWSIFGLGHKGALALVTMDPLLGLEAVEGLAHGPPGHAETLAQLALRGHARPGGQLADEAYQSRRAEGGTWAGPSVALLLQQLAVLLGRRRPNGRHSTPRNHPLAATLPPVIAHTPNWTRSIINVPRACPQSCHRPMCWSYVPLSALSPGWQMIPWHLDNYIALLDRTIGQWYNLPRGRSVGGATSTGRCLSGS